MRSRVPDIAQCSLVWQVDAITTDTSTSEDLEAKRQSVEAIIQAFETYKGGP